MNHERKSIRGAGLMMTMMAILLAWAALQATQRTAHHKTLHERGKSSAASALPDMRIDINRATVAELSALPGLGPALSQRIVDDRDEGRGRFQSIDDLDRVNGIGPVIIERLRPYVVCE